MRPYRIPTINKWVDLDTILSIEEPRFQNQMGFGGMFVELEWQHYLRDKPEVVSWTQSWLTDVKTRQFLPVAGPDGRPSQLIEVYDAVFVPFFTAWCGKSPKEMEVNEQKGRQNG